VGARDDEARDDEPLAELRLERHRDLVGRNRETWGRRILTAVFAAFILLAAANVFGQRPSSARASGPAATLAVSTPATVRGGLIFQTRIDVTASSAISHPTLILGGVDPLVRVTQVLPGPYVAGARMTLEQLDARQLKISLQFFTRRSVEANSTIHENRLSPEPRGRARRDRERRFHNCDG